MSDTNKPAGNPIVRFVSGAYHTVRGAMVLSILGLILLFVLGLAIGGDGGGGKPLSWKRVHDSTIFNTVDSLDGEVSELKPLAVVRFNGTVDASQRNSLARQVDEILVNRNEIGGVIVVVNSPGGGVAEYGQACAELKRLRDAKIDLTVCTDTYCASGGYLMSLPANRIVAAPYSMVGSIGVVTEMLNFNRLLQEIGVDPVILTAGKYKRTVTQTGAITEEGKKHYQEQLEAIHRAFIDVVKTYRPQINTEEVCTGDHWTAKESVEQNLGLVDELATSSDYLLRARATRGLIFLSEPAAGGSLLDMLMSMEDRFVDRVFTHVSPNVH